MPGQPLPLDAFADHLRAARTARGLSVRALEKAAGVSFSLISALENRRRSAGPATVEKLADALHLRGAERKEFMALGGDTSARHRVQIGNKRKGMQLLGKLVQVLAGVSADDIEDVIVEYKIPGRSMTYDFVIRLRDKRLLAGEVKQDAILIVASDPVTGLLPDPRQARRTHSARIINIPR